MLIKLLQSVDSFELDLAAQPADSLAPEGWKAMPGRQAIEKLFPKSHLTMHIHVRLPFICEKLQSNWPIRCTEGHVGSHEGSHK